MPTLIDVGFFFDSTKKGGNHVQNLNRLINIPLHHLWNKSDNKVINEGRKLAALSIGGDY